MTRQDFKRAGYIRAGFQYQDLVAVETLINFYRQRDLYSWVELEAEDDSFRCVEDVVACRPDGLYELTQVKFTADPHAPTFALSWEWLTENAGARRPGQRGPLRRSLLQKWAETTLEHIENGTLAQAALKTDRIPDDSFASCLNDGRVEFDRLPEEAKETIIEQLGSSETAQVFFDSFEFSHSMPVLDDFEEQLWSRMSSDTDEGGWYRFQQQVQRWATRRREPKPDGKIRYVHLRQAFAVERPKPLPQGFTVPEAYRVPDDKFDSKFLGEVTGSDGLTVLWGPPGQGKSTYLSHCVERLDPQEAVCIRHHYFLSLEDRSEGRFHYWAIFWSFAHQLEDAIPDLNVSPRSTPSIGELIRQAADMLREHGRRLVVIVDGLDHVWREHRDHEDMETLFEGLLPLPDNVHLIVGTQKVADEFLPARLLNALPTEHWTELPLMSQQAVDHWLRSQDEAGRLRLQVGLGQQREEVLRSVSEALHSISGGLPLHLIYSFEELVLTGNAVTEDDVRSLPTCPSGDIRDYYRSLWVRVGQKARTILHVLAGLEFGPPPLAMQECFGHSAESMDALAEIGHLLDYRGVEVRPFHGSLFSFVRDLDEHATKFSVNARDVLTWLRKDAPEYWRWAWLWITEAQLESTPKLLAEPSREWVIDSVLRGYPIEQVVNILERAEQMAFGQFDLPRFLALRALKERSFSGPTYQTDEWHLFREVALSVSDDPHLDVLTRTDLSRVPVDLLSFLARGVRGANSPYDIGPLMGEIDARRARIRDDHWAGRDERRSLIKASLAVAASDSSIASERIDKFVNQFDDPISLIEGYARESILASNFDNVLSAGSRWSSDSLAREVLAALCLEGINPATRPELQSLTHPAIRCLSLVLGGVDSYESTKGDLSHLFTRTGRVHSETSDEIRTSVYMTFFDVLAAGLRGDKTQGNSVVPANAQSTWLGGAVQEMERLAGTLADRWKTSHQWPTIEDVYASYSCHLPESWSFDDSARMHAVRLALCDVSVDLCTIAKGIDAGSAIDARCVESASRSPFWNDELWLHTFTERRLLLHSSEGAQVFLQRVNTTLDSTVGEFAEICSTAVRLALFASDHGQERIARDELRRAVGYLLGYGWHKDLFALEVLESLDLLAANGDSRAQDALLNLAGEFESITAYTDGDETDIVRDRYYRSIALHFPERVAGCYANLIRKEEWRYAEGLAVTFAGSTRAEDRIEQALLETFLTPAEAGALGTGTSSSGSHTNAILQSVLRKIGRTTLEQQKPVTPTSGNGRSPLDNNVQTDDPAVSLPHPGDFPPGELPNYLNAVQDAKSHDDETSLVGEWLRYWAGNGRADDALDELQEGGSGFRHTSDIDRALDAAFEISLATQGRTKAFELLKRAHVRNAGWERWYASEEKAHARLRQVSKHYPGEWRKFIEDTAKPKFATDATRNGIALGKSRLVRLLLEASQDRLAITCALELVRIFREELAEQPIEVPEWSR